VGSPTKNIVERSYRVAHANQIPDLQAKIFSFKFKILLKVISSYSLLLFGYEFSSNKALNEGGLPRLVVAYHQDF
jgi:hypothetical protein